MNHVMLDALVVLPHLLSTIAMPELKTIQFKHQNAQIIVGYITKMMLHSKLTYSTRFIGGSE